MDDRNRELGDVHLFPALAHATAHFFTRVELEPCDGTRDASTTRLLSSHPHQCVYHSLYCCMQISPFATSSRPCVQSYSFPSRSSDLIKFLLAYRWSLFPTMSPGLYQQLCLNLMQPKHTHVHKVFACLSVAVSRSIYNLSHQFGN